MEYFINSALFMTFVAMVSSQTYDRMDVIRDGYRGNVRVDSFRNLNGNSYTNGLVSNVGSTRSGGRSCYDRCYDAYVTGLRRGTNGCTCSRFDFRGRRNQGRNRGRSRINSNCNCPVGTVCEYQFGMTSCINSRNRAINPGYGSAGSGNRRAYVHGDNRVNLGLPGSRRLGGHCGYLTSACLASHTHPRQVLRYTYSYELGICIREHVYLACDVGGSRNNLFATRQGCTRTCI